jgi:hypothetical protein
LLFALIFRIPHSQFRIRQIPHSAFRIPTSLLLPQSRVSIRENLLFLQSVQADSADQNLYHVQACGSF